jgi:hypothetical protein
MGSCEHGDELWGFYKMYGMCSEMQEVLASLEVLCSVDLVTYKFRF